MFSRKITRLATVAILAVAFYPQNAHADGFTSAEFIRWPEASQDAYIHNSIGMSGVIASQSRQDISRCIDQWYFADKATQNRRNAEIKQVMQANPTFHPQGVLLAVIQKECGKFQLR